MADLNGQAMQDSAVADDANVLITVSTSEAEGMIRRWGVVSHAVGNLSVEALLRGAVDDRFLDLLRSQRPQQHESEEEVASRVKSILASGYRIFVRDSDDPIDSARARQVPARSLLARGNPEYQTGSFYVLHLTVEPFGAAAFAVGDDDADVANASEALRRGLGGSAVAAVATDVAPVNTQGAPVMAAEGQECSPAAIGPSAACADEACADATALPDQGGAPTEESQRYDGAYVAGVGAAAATELTLTPAEAIEPPASVSASAVTLTAAETVAAAAAEEGLHSGVAMEDVAGSETTSGQDPDAEGLEQSETIEVYVAQPKKRVRKIEALMDQFRPMVTALDFRGLFTGNFAGQASTAVDVTKLSALSPQTISAYLMKANALRQAGDYEKALSYYRVLLKSDPDNADYRFLYGKTLIEMGRIQPARECLERARELGHENAAHELEKLENRETKKPGLRFFRLLRAADTKR
jgi:hypothetical protein